MRCGHNGHDSTGVVLINTPLLTSHPRYLQMERPNSQVCRPELLYNWKKKKAICISCYRCLNQKL